MRWNYAFITVPFLVIVFIGLVYTFFYERSIFCWVGCMQSEISCLSTVSYTFGLVPATALAASSAMSGCFASFDICELSCSRRSKVQPYSATGTISNSCEIYRNGTKIKPIEIGNHWKLVNPFGLDALCRKILNLSLTDESTSTSIPPTTTPQKVLHPIAIPAMSEKNPAPDGNTSSTDLTDFKHPIVPNLESPQAPNILPAVAEEKKSMN